MANVPEEVLDRDDEWFAVSRHERQVPEPAHGHLVKRHGECVMVATDHRVRSHHVADADGVEVDFVASRLEEDIAVGNDSDDLFVFFDQHAVDATPLHDMDRKIYRIARGHSNGLLCADHSEGVVHQVLFELALGAGKVQVAEVLAAALAGIGAVNVIEMTGGAKHGYVVPILPSTCRLR
jgi:hypothetical protein